MLSGLRSPDERAKIEHAARAALDEVLVEMAMLAHQVERLTKALEGESAAYEHGYRDGRADLRDLGPME